MQTNRVTARAGVCPPARVHAAGTYEGQHLALLATPCSARTVIMAHGIPSKHERESFSERYTPGGVSKQGATTIAPNAETAFAELRQAALALQLAIPEADLCERVRRAVDDAAARDAGSMKELRLAVRSFTLALRDIGTTPERVLIALKTVINNRTLLVIAPHASDWNGDELREKISTWCLKEYFRKRTA